MSIGGGEAWAADAHVAAAAGDAAAVFRSMAQRIFTEIAPPLDMAGCTARMLAAVEAALDAL